MTELLLAAGSALWLGILTSISPCPLATNVAAVSFLGRRIDAPVKVLLSGLSYTAGRTLAYVLLAAVLIAGLLSIPGVSMFLQRHMNQALGPLLIVTAVLLTGWLPVTLPGFGNAANRAQQRESGGAWFAALLGLLFALSFCPVSAALFFGSLVPLSLEQESWVVMPTLYGVGTALPVVGFAVLIALGSRSVAVAFERLTVFERWARRVTAAVFLVVGLYMTWTYTAPALF
jgi:cytochrome c biogenesis protein CcdA